MTLPDLCGPTNTATFTYGGPMGGTSNACPNCAGAAVCLWSGDLALSPSAVNWLILEKAYLWQDWGTGGIDNIYGHGGMLLYDYAPNTLWVSRIYGNTSNDRAYPLYTVSGAQYWGVAGGRIVFIPGGNYPEPVTLNKWLRYETIEYSAILGE
jgi:subtilisin family serine protease